MGAAQNTQPVVKPRVIDYHDYRLFLKDWFAYLETQDRDFSLRQLARESNVGVSFLSMMLSGQRGLSQSMFQKIGPFLKLGVRDLEILSLLRDLTEAENHDIRLRTLSLLLKRPEYRGQHPREFATFNYLTAWYFVAIREMASLPDFQFDAKWIQSRLRDRMPLEMITKSMEFLEQQGFLQRTKPYITDKTLECMGGVFTLALGTFHRQMLTKTAQAIETVPRDERLILGHTVTLGAEQIEKANKILFEALQKIADLGESEQTREQVYHFTFGAIPLTVKKGNSDEG